MKSRPKRHPSLSVGQLQASLAELPSDVQTTIYATGIAQLPKTDQIVIYNLLRQLAGSVFQTVNDFAGFAGERMHEQQKRLDNRKPEHQRDLEIVRLRDEVKKTYPKIAELISKQFGDIDAVAARRAYWRKKRELMERDNYLSRDK